MYKTRKEIYILILCIIVILDGELAIFLGDIFSGLEIHIISFLTIIFIIIFGDLSIDVKNILQSLILLILLRMVNLSVPQLFTTTLLLYPLMYGVMFIPIFTIIKNQRISLKELGINFNRIYIYIPVAILIGIIMGIIEYRILNPLPLIKNFSYSDIILISIVMFIFIGSVEEIIFRSILQTRIEKVLGQNYGLLLSGSIFGIMHVTYGVVNELLFASMFGIILAYAFLKTRSVIFTISIHGVTNIMLFAILPLLKGYI